MLRVYFVSDHTGITAEMLGRSLLSRFEGLEARTITRAFIDSAAKARALTGEIDALEEPPLVVSSIALPDVRTEVKQADALVLDLFEPFLERLEAFLQRAPSERAGTFHGLRDLARYQARIDAVEYALGTDDGLGTSRYDTADVILLGVSRVGKTPTCLYLAMHYGVYAANYPIDADDLGHFDMPKSLQPFAGRLYGLTIDPIRLQHIRQARRGRSDYATLERCRRELSGTEALFRQYGLPCANVTTLSVEEIAAGIMQDERLPLARRRTRRL